MVDITHDCRNSTHTDWPGLLEVRAVYCTRFKPSDGVEAALGTGSPAFAALCPEDTDVKALEATPRARQITGEVLLLSADPELQALIAKVATRVRSAARRETGDRR